MADREKIVEAYADYEPYARDLPCVTIKSRVYMDVLELLKEQQQKKAELLKQFDKEIECAEQARIGSACEGENAWVEHYACQKRNYEHAKSIVENTL